MIVTGVHITRTLLSLPDLDLNDRTLYRWVGVQPGEAKFRRQQVSSPYVDGAFTTHRTRDIREITFVVDVQGPDRATQNTAMNDLIEAFEQDRFQLGWTLDGEPTLMWGECADYTMNYEQVRVWARRMQVEFKVPVQPNLISGRL